MLKNDKTSLSDHHNAIIVYSNHEPTTSKRKSIQRKIVRHIKQNTPNILE